MHSVAVGCIFDGNNRRSPIVCCCGKWLNMTDSVHRYYILQTSQQHSTSSWRHSRTTLPQSSDPDPLRATEKLRHLNLLQHWLQQWRIKVNPTKSAQATFTTSFSSLLRVTFLANPITVHIPCKHKYHVYLL